jgi:hypothetical protein
MAGPFGTTFGDLVRKLTVLRVECHADLSKVV